MAVPIADAPLKDLQQQTNVGLSKVPGAWASVPNVWIKADPVFIEKLFDPTHTYTSWRDNRVCINETTDQQSFRRFITWLFCGQASLDPPVDEDDEAEVDEEYQLGLAKLYIFAHRLPILALKNQVIEVYFDFVSEDDINLDLLQLLHQEDLVTSSLTQLILDSIANHLFISPKSYKSAHAWSVKLQKLIDKQTWLCKAMLDANFRAAQRKGKRLNVRKYLETHKIEKKSIGQKTILDEEIADEEGDSDVESDSSKMDEDELLGDTEVG